MTASTETIDSQDPYNWTAVLQNASPVYGQATGSAEAARRLLRVVEDERDHGNQVIAAFIANHRTGLCRAFTDENFDLGLKAVVAAEVDVPDEPPAEWFPPVDPNAVGCTCEPVISKDYDGVTREFHATGCPVATDEEATS